METKLEKKVEFFKEHLNSGKSAYELEHEFETWYEEVYKKKQYEEYLKQLKEDIQNESEIKLDFFNKRCTKQRVQLCSIRQLVYQPLLHLGSICEHYCFKTCKRK